MTKEEKELVMITGHCVRANIKITPLRKKIIIILLESDIPLTAYAVLDKLKQTKPNAQVMTVYRILDFLIQKGLVHKIESLNAFMICNHLEKEHISQWLICHVCGASEEFILKNSALNISEIKSSTGFLTKSCSIEMLGVCASCQL